MGALHRFLVEFDAPARPGMPALPWPMAGLMPPPAEEIPAEPAVDTIAEAVAVARAEAAEAGAAALAALEERHAADLAEARARWAAAEGERLAESLRHACAALEQRLAEGVVAVLEPLIATAARSAAVAGLATAVGDLLRAGPGAVLAVEGPQDLLDALRGALGAAAAVTFTPSEAAEATVTAEGSRIETRLAAWAQGLHQRLGDPA